MRKILFFALALLALASCENEKEPPAGAGSFPQITLVNNSPTKAYLFGFDLSGNSLNITTGNVEPYSSAQAKFRETNIDPAGEYVRIQVWKREDSAADTKLYEEGLMLHMRDKYTFTVDKNYNVSYRTNR